MKRILSITFLASTIISTLLLAGCQGASMPQLFWSADDGKPDYARSSGSHVQGASRAPLDVPPELRKEIEMPMADKVAVDVAKGEQITKAAVAGKAVALDTRIYPTTPAKIFSATVDAMTALNMPVQSVDSPSGVITSDWIRPNAGSASSYLGVFTSMVGAGPVHMRYRFIIRVFRTKTSQSELQIRTLGQQFMNGHWVNRPINKKISKELFTAVEEQLARMKSMAPAPIAPAQNMPAQPPAEIIPNDAATPATAL